MATRARFSSPPADAAWDADDGYGHVEHWPGERLGPPPSGRGGKIMACCLLFGILGAGGWALLADHSSSPLWQAVETTVGSWMSSSRTARSEAATISAPPLLPIEAAAKPATAEPARPLLAPSSASLAPARAPDLNAAPVVRPVAPREAAPEETAAADPSRGPDPTDPYQLRAAAVGLHPDLSRALLERLSPTDYHNAGIAIKTAVAETPDNAVFVWPRQRKPELALFQVRFVPGAAPSCRRYVVSITKDGWLTTAPPMERCGPQPGPSRRQ
jgi:hypothetical protein